MMDVFGHCETLTEELGGQSVTDAYKQLSRRAVFLRPGEVVLCDKTVEYVVHLDFDLLYIRAVAPDRAVSFRGNYPVFCRTAGDARDD